MRILITFLVLSSVLMACDRKQEPVVQPDPPVRNELEMDFLGENEADKNFGFQSEFSSVECRYDSASDYLRVVAYRFGNTEEFKVEESLQLTDYRMQTNQSGTLQGSENDPVPPFVFFGTPLTLTYTNQSNCSTFYEVDREVIKGNILCSALENDMQERVFVSLRFQCKNQDFLLFEINNMK